MNLPSWPLDGIKVVEYAQFVSGPFCGKMLAELGAEVIKIEPPVGDVSRSRGPFPGDSPHPEKSALFLYLNTNKLGITLNLGNSAGRKLFLDLLQDADVLVEDCAPGFLDELGIGYKMLAKRKPKLVMTSITPFGQSGPYRDHKAYYLNTFHAGGEGYCMPTYEGSSLYADREPLRVGAFAGEAFCGQVAALATAVAIMRQLAEGVGEHVDISKQEALLHTAGRIDISLYPNEGIIKSRATLSGAGAMEHTMLECMDGSVCVSLDLDNETLWRHLVDGMGWPDGSRVEAFQDPAYRRNHAKEILAHINVWANGKTKNEAYHLLQSFGVTAGGVETAKDILNSPQLNAREYFVQAEHPVAGTLAYASLPFEFSGRKRRRPAPAPLLGQHNGLVFCQRMGHTEEAVARFRALNVI